MIGYLFLCGALLCGVTKGYCGKKSSGTIRVTSDALLVNTLRMLLCILIGALLLTIQGGWSAPSGDTIWISALSGIFTAAFTVCWLLAVKQSAYMLVDVFLLSGTILPIALSCLFLKESVRPLQMLGILLLIFAAYLISAHGKENKAKIRPRDLALPILAALSNGMVDFSQKLFVAKTGGGANTQFTLFTYVFALVLLGVVCLVLRKRDAKRGDATPPRQVLLPIAGYVAVMALCLFLHAYLKTAAAAHLPSASLYPLSQGGALVLSALMATLLLKEKLGLRAILGIVLAFGALLLINLF